MATYTSLRSFLLSRVDSALAAGATQVERAAFSGHGGPDSEADGRGAGDADSLGQPTAPGVEWYQVRSSDGRIVTGGFLVAGGSPPRLPAGTIVSSSGARNAGHVRYLTVSSTDGTSSFRVRAAIEPDYPGRILLTASSLNGVYGTLRRLVVIELLATLAVLAAIGGLGLWVVRLGLRPLGAIESTAAAIAAGDLSQRVERAEGETEVGRLGLSLNAMLAQIETGVNAVQRSEERLRRFVADASHELRTPLTAVRAYAELFDRGASSRPDDLERLIAGIRRESERMSLLVEDLLLLARLDEGRPLERLAIDLDELVAEAVDAARVVDPERPIGLALEPARVTGDGARLRQVVDNLLANVRAHTPPASPVRVSLERRGGRAILSVSDSGPGLAEEQLRRAFERFYRADESRSRARGGVGLGLSIVAAVARAHGGDVSARSVGGQGTSFVVELPLAAG